MKIHAITVVKNEADIIQTSLQAALKWADNVFVLDNGSEDDTWERVRAIANDRIVAWKRDDGPFRESLRGDVFNQFRHQAKPGDWWCRLDSDEFYTIECPRLFLSNVPLGHHVVWAIYVDYFVTETDLEDIDFSLPPEEILAKLRYYRANFSEPRFFRHRDGIEWPANGAWPLHMGIVTEKRILFKHYKYRSPAQIQSRVSTRLKSRERGFEGWNPDTQLNWSASGANLNYDNQDGKFVIDWATIPNHIESFSIRFAKRIMHKLGVWP